jgi:hypothetical protein
MVVITDGVPGDCFEMFRRQSQELWMTRMFGTQLSTSAEWNKTEPGPAAEIQTGNSASGSTVRSTSGGISQSVASSRNCTSILAVAPQTV